MGQTVVNGNVMGETNDKIVVIPSYNSGIKIAEIRINNDTYELFVPTNVVQNSQNGGNN